MRARSAVLLIGMCLCASVARAGQLSILEENDSLFFTSDKHYTQGIRGAYLSDPLASDDWRYKAFDLVPVLFPDAAASERRFDWIFLGQSIFTPINLTLNPPDPHDRPYAGWLYTGGSLLQENGNQLTGLELLLGVVGPAALGRQVQNDWHQFIVGIPGGEGWHDQLKNEPALVLSYERRWRVGVADFGDVGIDIVPEAGVNARNVFLGGNAFASSPHVAKKPLVGDLTAGVALFWKNDLRLDIGLLTRTKEFYGQQGEDSYAGFRFSFGL